MPRRVGPKHVEHTPIQTDRNDSFSEKVNAAWETMHPLLKASVYTGLGLTLAMVLKDVAVTALEKDYVMASEMIVDLMLFPVVEELFYRGALGQVVKTAQIVVHRIKTPHRPPTDMELEAEATLRVAITSLAFAASHPDQQVNKFVEMGRATGYLYEKKGMLSAIACHSAHNLISQLAPSLIKVGIPESMIGISQHLFYFIIFKQVLEKPFLPMPDFVKRKFSALNQTVKNMASNFFLRNSFA